METAASRVSSFDATGTTHIQGLAYQALPSKERHPMPE
jgi:hypothetical protein